MRRSLHSVILLSVFLIFTLLLSGCNNFQIAGLENFNENDCCFGLNDGLLPDGKNFLSDYPYQTGDYQYWRNNYGNAQAKTFVQLYYSKNVYQEAKLVCQEHFTFSEQSYLYNDFVFCAVNVAGGNITLDSAFPGFRMFGYNDDKCSLVFIGYLNDDNGQIFNSDFGWAINNQFGDWLIAN